MEQLLVWVKKLAVFMILCSYMEHLLPAQYKRYFHMCTGLILILMITSPLRQVLQGNIGSEVSCLLENLRTGSQVYQMKGEDGKRYQAYYMKQYKAAMTEQIKNLADMSGLRAEEIRLSVNEDVSSDSYGCPTEVSMHVLSEDGMEADNGSKKAVQTIAESAAWNGRKSDPLWLFGVGRPMRMADFKAFWQRFKSGENGGKGQKDRFMLLALVGLLILVAVWPVGGKSGKTSGQTEASVEKKQETSYNYTDQYAAVMESRLKSMLESVEGAGEVKVMITLKNNGEQVVEKDRTYSENKTGQGEQSGQTTTNNNISRSESTVYSSSNGGSPYVVKQIEPEIEGVLVAAQGGGDETVVNEITYAVQVLFDVPVHKIKVVKMSSR